MINQWAVEHKDDAMLAHTHGQPATPTTIGKEFKVYAYRLMSSIENIESIQIKAKFNGATGNYSAILTAFPNVDWQTMAKKFVEEYLGLTFNPLTTQIESHDYTCHILDGIRHFNNVLVDFDVDMWLYISMEYFKQIPVKGEEMCIRDRVWGLYLQIHSCLKAWMKQFKKISLIHLWLD